MGTTLILPDRVQLRRTRGWRKPPNTIVVARPTRWGNPYRIDDYRADWPEADDDALRRMAVSDFRGLLEHRWVNAPECDIVPAYPSIDEIRGALAGFNLACWCGPKQCCHADVLIRFANIPTLKAA